MTAIDETKAPGLVIAQVFLLRARFEHAPNVMELPPTTPLKEQQIKVEVKVGLTENELEGFVDVTVATNEGDEDGLYRYHLEMIGLCKAEGPNPNVPLRLFLEKSGGATMYPFVREALANLTGRGRFGPVWLKPMNFAALEFKIPEQPEEKRL